MVDRYNWINRYLSTLNLFTLKLNAEGKYNMALISWDEKPGLNIIILAEFKDWSL